MTVTTAVGGDPRDMAALVTISRGMMIGGGPISKIGAQIATASSGGPREAVYDIALASDKFVTPAVVLRDPQNQRGDDIPGKLVVLVDEDGEYTLVDLYLIFGEHRLRAVERIANAMTSSSFLSVVRSTLMPVWAVKASATFFHISAP